MSFGRYPAYKDSGVEWLGSVPSAWEIAPIKAVASCNDEVLPESTDSEAVIEYVEISGVEEGRGVTATETLAFGAAPSRARRVVRHGDVLISTVRTYLRAIATVTNPPENLVASTGFAAIRPRSVDAGFLGYLLHAEYLMSEVIARSVGVSYPAINASELMRLKAPIPPLQEQQAISAFLDRETAKIDALVEEQKRLIELLKEKRQAVISQAVTKGLDPSVPMKDSGVEWLGEVPGHWEVKRLKHISPRVTVGIVVEPSKHYAETGVPALRSLNVRQDSIEPEGIVYITPEGHSLHSKSRLNEGDLVAVRSGQPGTTAVVPANFDGCNCIDLLVIRQPIAGCSEFLCRFMNSDAARIQYMHGSGGAIQQHFNVEAAGNLVLAWPPHKEQLSIAASVARQVKEFDGLIDDATMAVSLLGERRSALISAAVTGKIDVRGLVPQPEATAA